MTSNVSFYKRHSLLRSASLLLLLTVALSLSAQVIPQLESPPRISVFSTLAEVKPDYQILRRLRGLGSHLGSLFAKPTHPGDRGKVICDEMGRPGVRGISPCWSSLFNAFRPSFSVSLHSGRRSERLALEQPASYWAARTSIRRGPWSPVVNGGWARHLLRTSFCDSDGGAFLFQDIPKRLDDDASHCECGDCLSITLANNVPARHGKVNRAETSSSAGPAPCEASSIKRMNPRLLQRYTNH